MRRASAKREPFVLGSKEEKQTFSLRAKVPSVPVPTGLSPQSHQLQLRLHKKKDKQTENSARMHFIEGNNNIVYIPGIVTVDKALSSQRGVVFFSARVFFLGYDSNSRYFVPKTGPLF